MNTLPTNPITRTAADRERIDKVWRIFRSEYPEYCVTHAERYRSAGLQTDKVETPDAAKARVFLNELSALDDVQLAERHQAWAREERLREEANHPFNQPTALATEAVNAFYSKAAFWTLDEGVALLLERTPKRLNTENLADRDFAKSKIGDLFLETRELIMRARVSHHLSNQNSPAKFLDWAVRTRIPVPAPLLAAVQEQTQHEEDHKARQDQQADQTEFLRQEVERLTSLLAQQDAKTQDGALGTLERSSLLKLILGMAIANYKHDPRALRTTTASAMLQDFDTVGIAISDDTIRKYLHEAAEYAPPPKTE